MGLEWNDSLKVGIGIIDSQHKGLIEKIIELVTAMKQGKGSDNIPDMLKFLGEYVVTHFSTEEDLMQKHSYPEMEAHKREHKVFTDKFAEYKSQIDSEGVSSSKTVQINNYLTMWLLNHINRVDKKLGNFLVEQGVQAE